MLSKNDFVACAATLGVPYQALMAVVQVEAPEGGFDLNGAPRILFEGHVFSRLTGGVYDKTNPTISYPKWTTAFYAKGENSTVRNAKEHERLHQAVQISRGAALMSASWGIGQIMGENYATAGFQSLQDFINAMYASEGEQLKALAEFVEHDRRGKVLAALKTAVRTGNWTPFSLLYNGPEQAKNKHDTRLALRYKALGGTYA